MTYRKVRCKNETTGEVYFFTIAAGETEETNTILFASLVGSDVVLQSFFGLEDLTQNVIPEYVNSLEAN